ncbi:MAG: hypothetical protein HZC02_02600 [Candidatus Levybacteria bacterium]|nr:hypothetical protein [Candidatus Levybacteria bacterium]
MGKTEQLDFSPPITPPEQDASHDVYWGYAQRVHATQQGFSNQAALYFQQGVPKEEVGEELDELRSIEGEKMSRNLWERANRISENIAEAREMGADADFMIGRKDAFLTGILIGMAQVGGRNSYQYFPNVSLSVAKRVSDPYLEFSSYRVTAVIANPDNPDQTHVISSRLPALIPHVRQATGHDVGCSVIAKQLLQKTEHKVVEESPDDFVFRRFHELKDISRALIEAKGDNERRRYLSLLRTQCERDLLYEWAKRKRGALPQSSISLHTTQFKGSGRKTPGFVELKMQWGSGNTIVEKVNNPWDVKNTGANEKLRRELRGLQFDEVFQLPIR